MNTPGGLRHSWGGDADAAQLIRVRGTVQGVGFRPMVWRLARQHGLRGWVSNDGQGVVILVRGPPSTITAFAAALPEQAPPLARIEAIERNDVAMLPDVDDFRIAPSQSGNVHTGVAPDAATCAACVAEIFDPSARRFRYAFTNCTHCGPRLAIIDGIPYDRGSTTMRAFRLCADCQAEYSNPEDRRYHAQPVACPACGPRVWLEAGGGAGLPLETPEAADSIDAACTLIKRGHIVAVKGLGGFQLACDACNGVAVARLRALKHRERKPFALMARDLAMLNRYCTVTAAEAALLQSPAAPIVVLDATGPAQVAAAVAPDLSTLGFMLPNTPLHHLLLHRMGRPIVLTSGNLSDEPQCIANADARSRLGGIADFLLLHDRDIARRVDDSLVRIMAGTPRLLRRARGYAPAPIALPKGFAGAEPVLAMGGELKNTFCLLRDGQAIVSHHMGDLADALCHADYLASVEQYRRLFAHEPRTIAVDLHPEYLSRKRGLALAERHDAACIEVQHHHAHIAACMAENGIALDAEPVLGVALDGLGYGADGSLWGGEFLLADYRRSTRLACFKPVAMPGGEQAIFEPWRNTYAHLMAALGWRRFTAAYGALELHRFLAGKPRALLDTMIVNGVNSPRASSCGRLFDAVAAAAGICRERAAYEGQAAAEFEALVDVRALGDENDGKAYPFALRRPAGDALPVLDPLPMWQALLDDLAGAVPVPVIAARFHKGLAIAVVRTVDLLLGEPASSPGVTAVALSGGVFQNRVLFEQVVTRLEDRGLRVLAHGLVPANDGGISLGQAAVAAARTLSP